MRPDYDALGFKAGLEIHQQLDTTEKLFCRCPPILKDVKDAKYSFNRYLRLSESELGEKDRAAMEEEKKGKKIRYIGYDTTCLVEMDEEPPGPLNIEALDIALEISLLMNMHPVDKVFTMRKIVLDGSNTSGFQRTAYISSNGKIESRFGDVSISSLCLEEDAAQKIDDTANKEDTYSLDRLGIPLVEISTAADIKSPEQLKEVAERIGMILRSTEKVKRGLGTIRQDVNISIKDGARVEIKGVQDLGSLEKVAKNEVIRQINLLNISKNLKDRGAIVNKKIFDVSDIFGDFGYTTFAINLSKFDNLPDIEREFDTILKRFNLNFYAILSDENDLNSSNIDETRLIRLKEKVNYQKEDLIIIVQDKRKKAIFALNSVIDRADYSLIGVPEETRRSLPDGTSEYMRPLPGAARMYPETDVEPIKIDRERLDDIRESLPELIDRRTERYIKDYRLNEELASLISRSKNYKFFEDVVDMYNLPPALIIRTLEITPQELKRNNIPVENLTQSHFISLFRIMQSKEIAKEGIPQILEFLAKNPDKSVEDAIRSIGLDNVDLADVEKFIDKIMEEKRDLLINKRESSLSPLMGIAMKEFRGKVDGKKINDILKRKIDEFIKNI